MSRRLLGVLALAAFASGCSMLPGAKTEPPAVSGSTSGTTSMVTTPASATIGVSRDTVREIQTSLQAKGFYKGPLDGIIGPQTRAALANYRQSEGLPPTAVLDQKTLHELTASATASNAAATSGSGSSAPPRMSAGQIRDQVQAQGYSNVTAISPWGNNAYTAKASKNGQSYTLQIDGHTGKIFSVQ